MPPLTTDRMKSMATIHAQQVAAELRRRLPGLGVKKLHKLLYYCQGHHLATFDEPLFVESISAWDMGPVVGTLWKSEKDHGVVDQDAVADEAVLNTLGYVVSRYGALTGHDLEHLTHSEDPWLSADSQRDRGGTTRIPNELIADYFRRNSIDDDEIQPDPLDLEEWLRHAGNNQTAGAQDTVESIRERARSHG